jgi:hypothetical protein
MTDFRVRISGALTPDEDRALGAAGIRQHELEPVMAGFNDRLDVTLSYVRVDAADEEEARRKVAGVLGVNPEHLQAVEYPDEAS